MPAVSAVLIAVFVASLVGSLHCAGMCGPFLAFAVSSNPKLAAGGRSHAAPNLAYQLGRLTIYVLLGSLSGLLGQVLDLGGLTAGVGRAAALLAGGTLIGIGALTCMQHFAVRLPQIPVPAALRRGLAAGHRVAAGLAPIPRAGLIGLLSAVLPCGWLYGFVIAAAGTASPLAGAAVMLAFWGGTVPVMAALGLAAQRAGTLLGGHVRLAASLAVLLIGVLTISSRVHALDVLPQGLATARSPDALRAEVHNLDAEHAACCRGAHE